MTKEYIALIRVDELSRRWFLQMCDTREQAEELRVTKYADYPNVVLRCWEA